MSKKREVDYFFGVTVGALLGISLAILFVPRSGEETRELVKRKVISAGDKAAQLSSKVHQVQDYTGREVGYRTDDK